jgi:SAM-dependent methyltransferase
LLGYDESGFGLGGSSGGGIVELNDVTACPVCGSSLRTAVCFVPDPKPATSRQFSVVRCRRCGVGYVSNGPPSRELSSYYPRDYGGYGAGGSVSARVLTRLNSLLLGQEVGSNLGLPLLDPIPGSNALLDVGVGGELARQMVARGWRVWGLDFTPALAESGSLCGIEFVVGDAVRTPFRDASFDLVIASHVLEHLYDPLSALKEYARLLRPGGRPSVGVPNFDSFPSRFFGRVTYAYLDVPRHLIFFNVGGLTEAVTRSGLTVARVRTVPFPALLPTLLMKIGLSPAAIDHGASRVIVNSVSLPFDVLTQTGARGSNIVLIALKNTDLATPAFRVT